MGRKLIRCKTNAKIDQLIIGPHLLMIGLHLLEIQLLALVVLQLGLQIQLHIRLGFHLLMLGLHQLVHTMDPKLSQHTKSTHDWICN